MTTKTKRRTQGLRRVQHRPAVNPRHPKRIVATGQAVQLSTDGGRRWTPVLALNEGAGPVAWAPSAARTAYLVGFDRTLYRSTDGGANWRRVESKP